ncbi:MAG TPA: hypothetical protein VK886_01710 [Vicinamibacterales bacterium]|nr:hypothetical protein [Vicinamibacterales bacterium]
MHPIALGGLVVGVLDILAAFAVRAAFTGAFRPMLVLQGIASGLLGPSAFQGGASTAALGMALHFLIAFVVAAVYFTASRRLRVLVRQPFLYGPIYGVLVYLVMNQIVLPLSRVNLRTPPMSLVATMILVHMVFVGLPIALVVSRASKTLVGARVGQAH